MTRKRAAREWPRVGDRVYVVFDGARGDGRRVEMTVDKLGVKWATLSDGKRTYNPWRFDVHTGRIDGGGFTSPGRVFRDAEDHRTTIETERAWVALRVAVEGLYRLPKGVTLATIDEARRLLGLTPRKERS